MLVFVSETLDVHINDGLGALSQRRGRRTEMAAARLYRAATTVVIDTDRHVVQ